jgi:hypothetical protein
MWKSDYLYILSTSTFEKFLWFLATGGCGRASDPFGFGDEEKIPTLAQNRSPVVRL